MHLKIITFSTINNPKKISEFKNLKSIIVTKLVNFQRFMARIVSNEIL